MLEFFWRRLGLVLVFVEAGAAIFVACYLIKWAATRSTILEIQAAGGTVFFDQAPLEEIHLSGVRSSSCSFKNLPFFGFEAFKFPRQVRIASESGDLDLLGRLTSIEVLVIESNQEIDLKQIKQLRKLKTLTIVGAPVKNLALLKEFSTLRRFNLLLDSSTDIRPLYECKQLVHISLPEYGQSILDELHERNPNASLNFSW